MSNKDLAFLEQSISKCLSQSYKIKMNFDKAYSGEIGWPQSRMESYIANLPEIQAQFNSSNISYNPSLKNIHLQLMEIFKENPEKLNDIAQAVEEHNIDFIEKGNPKRFISGNIYSKIIEDADKDSVAQTFAFRTISYASGVWAKKRPDVFLNKDGSLNKAAVCSHVLHQSNERFRPSQIDYELSTQKRGPMPYFEDSLSYKSSVNQIKGVRENPDGTIFITPFAGDDRFSVLDQISGDTEISQLKSETYKTLEFWANPTNKEKSLTEIGELFDAVQIVEKQKAISEGVQPNDFVFSKISNDVISAAIIAYEAYAQDINAQDYKFQEIIGNLMNEHQKEQPQAEIPTYNSLDDLLSSFQNLWDQSPLDSATEQQELEDVL